MNGKTSDRDCLSLNRVLILPAVLLSLLAANGSVAFAHDDSHDEAAPHTVDASTPVDDHVLTDVAPTLAEETKLLKRVEEERIGVNPATDTATSASPGSVASAKLTARAATRAFNLATDPAQTGRWEPLKNWPVIPIFASVMPDGRVLTFDSVGDAPTESYVTHSYTRASIWDPATDNHSRIDSDTGFNLFCSGFATLEDGRLFIAGGNADAALRGIQETHTFNPLSNSWARAQQMDFARWYPAVTPLANGEMLITGGGFPISEVRETDGAIRRLDGASSSLWNNREYPWLQTAPDGRVAFLGPSRQLGYVNTDGAGSFQATNLRELSSRNYGSYAMYDIGKVMVAGGGYQNNNTDQRATNLVDLTTNSVTASNPMNNRRRQHDLTVLADGSVLATGGFASNQGLVDLQNSVFQAELWRPDTGVWQPLAAEDRARHYHSIALLLPDGRVLSGGGGICGVCQQVGYIQKNAQVFTPPYLFAQDGSGALAPRPNLGSVPAAIGYSRSFAVATAQGNQINKVALVRTGSVTHSQNMEQRFIPLNFSVTGSGLSIQSPANANIAPPGHYMLFIIDQAGVPSVAEIISVRESLDDPAPATNVINASLSGTARQSSTAFGGQASAAIDGNTDGHYPNGSVTHTANTRQPWWEVDLGEIKDIKQVVINRRSDCCTDRLANFHVLVSDTPFNDNTLSDTLARPGVSDHYVPISAPERRIDVARPGRYVRVQLAGSGTLELAEVQVLIDGSGQPGACGAPGVDAGTEGGLHLWKACDGPWTLMLSGDPGAGTVSATGAISADIGFISVSPQSLEASDTLTNNDPQRIRFDLRTASPWMDSFEFTTLGGDALCIATEGRPLFIGPDRLTAGTGPINPETLQNCVLSGNECTEPDFDPRTDRALLSWIDCDGVLRMIGSGGLQYARYSGHVYTDAGFTNTSTRSFESSDTLTDTSESAVFFNMGMGGGFADEILLTTVSTAEICVEITAQATNTQLLAGADRTPVTSPFNPRTLAPCQPPSGGPECGDPQVDANDDSALFVWMNCDGSWSVTLTGVQPDGGPVKVQGSITSSAGFSFITPRGIESSDTVSQSAGGPLTFDMTTINPWSDGFDFDVPISSALCVTLANVSAGLDILAGPDRTPVGTSFDPATYAACS